VVDVDGGAVEGSSTDKTVVDVDWKPSTVVLEDPGELDLHMSADGTTLDIGQAPPELKSMAAGAHVMISEVGLFKVMSVSSRGDGVSLVVTPGSLLDAADRGELSWEIDLRKAPVMVAVDRRAAEDWIVDKADPAAQPTPDMPPSMGVSAEFSGKLGNITASLKLNKKDDKYTAEVSAELPAAVPFKFTAKGTITIMKVGGTFKFADQQVEEYSQNVSGLTFEGDYSITGGGKSFEQQLALPVGLYVPIPLGGFPAYVGISAKFTLRSTLEKDESASFRSKFRVRGGDGLSYKNGEWSGAETLTLDTFETPDAEFQTIANTALAVTMELPRITIGAGVVIGPTGFTPGISSKAPDISEGIYMALKSETLQNIVLGIRDLEKQHCRFVDNNMAVNVGGEIKVFKLSINREVQAWFNKGTPRQDGDGCDFLKHP
jgi:hypothetical protein